MSHEDATTLSAPIVSVTLLEDRARVVRRGTVNVDPSNTSNNTSNKTSSNTSNKSPIRLLVDGVAPVLVDKTLASRVSGSSATISDTRVVRRRVPEVEELADDASERDLLITELKQRKLEHKRMSAEAELLDAEADGLSRLASWTLGDLADDVSRGRGLDGETYTRLDSLRERERELRSRAARAWHEIERYTAATARLERRVDALASPSTRRWCGIIIDLDAARAGDVTIELEYVVSAAMWRPAHTATLTVDDEDAASMTAELATSACVWQHTGEDWDDAQLLFSTERASLGAEPPVLSTDLLRVKKRQDQLVVETREQEVHSLSGRADDVSVARELPGIDDGGQTVALRSDKKVSVPSDGRPHRIPLAAFSAPVEVKLWSHPEQTGAVIYRTVMTNRGETPLLAGPVELIRAGGWVGRTSIGFVAPGEEFELSWGAEPTLRVRRSVRDSKEESRALSAWVARKRKVVVRVSNLGREPRKLSIRERIPVSEIEKVKIEIEKKDISRGAMPDDDGFVTWELELAPRSHEKLELRYTLRRHSDVVGV